MTPSPSWPELPPELLSLISTKLLTISELIRFRGVCRSWLDMRERTCTDLHRLIHHLECYAFMEPHYSTKHPPQGIVAFVVYRSVHQFIFCRSGDEEWTQFLKISMEVISIASLAYHKGNFYFVDIDGMVSVWDVSGGGEPERMPNTLPPLEVSGFRRIVVLDDDELILIVRRDFRQWHNQVFRLDLKREDSRWEKVKGIGGHTVFMSPWWLPCVLVTDAVGFRGNIIYCSRWMNSGPHRAENIEVYDIGDERIRRLPCNNVIGEGDSKMMASTWFTASFS